MTADEPHDELTMPAAAVNKRRYYALMLVGIILPFLLYPFLGMIFYSSGKDYTLHLTVSRLLIWAVLGLLVLYARYAEVQKFLLWRDEKYGFKFYAVSFVVLWLVVFVAGYISRIPALLGWHDNYSLMIRMMQIMKAHPVLLVFGSISAGITEELYCRGYMLSRLSLFFKNKYIPVIISALMFSCAHLGYKNLREIIYTFLFGMIFGYHYQKYRNIKVLIILHVAIDLFAFLFYGLHK